MVSDDIPTAKSIKHITCYEQHTVLPFIIQEKIERIDYYEEKGKAQGIKEHIYPFFRSGMVFYNTLRIMSNYVPLDIEFIHPTCRVVLDCPKATSGQ